MTADVPQQAVAAAGRRLDSWAARRQAQGSDVPAAAPNGGSGPAAASLSDTCRLLAAAFDSTSTAMAVTTATGLVVQGNAALGALLGCPAGQLLGRQVQDLSDVGDAAAVTAALGRSLQPGVAQPAVSVRLRHTDGGLRPARSGI